MKIKEKFKECVDWVKENPGRTVEIGLEVLGLAGGIYLTYKNTKLNIRLHELEKENETLKTSNDELRGSVKTLERQNHKLVRESNEKDYHVGKLAGEIERRNNSNNFNKTRKR